MSSQHRELDNKKKVPVWLTELQLVTVWSCLVYLRELEVDRYRRRAEEIGEDKAHEEELLTTEDLYAVGGWQAVHAALDALQGGDA